MALQAGPAGRGHVHDQLHIRRHLWDCKFGALGSALGSLSCPRGSKGWGGGAEPALGARRGPAHSPAAALQVAAVLTLPFDVVKTQRQIELGDGEVHPGEGLGSGRVPGGQLGPLGTPRPSPAALSPQSQPPSLPPPGCFCGASVPSPAPGGCLQVRPCLPCWAGAHGCPSVTKGLTGLSFQASCPASLRWHRLAPS